MKLEKKDIEKIIAVYDKRAQAAYDNYQDSGAEHYYKTYEKNEAMRDLLVDASNAEMHITRSKTFASCLRRWAAEIEEAKHKDIQSMQTVMDSIRNEICFLEKYL